MAITASGITVSLGGKPILHEVDAQVRPGEVLGLIGPNGAGKTTLLRVLATLLTPDCGSVDYDGASARALGRAALARRIAFLAQGGEAPGALSVEALVGLGRLPHRRPFADSGDADRQAIARALALCDVTGFAGRAVGTLSGGERRRVLLARRSRWRRLISSRTSLWQGSTLSTSSTPCNCCAGSAVRAPEWSSCCTI
nr:ABC transporter ATP-binding protein [Bosea sp. Root670]